MRLFRGCFNCVINFMGTKHANFNQQRLVTCFLHDSYVTLNHFNCRVPCTPKLKTGSFVIVHMAENLGCFELFVK